MGRLYMLLFALEVLLVVLALISCLSAEEDDLRALPRIVWVIIILLFPLVGSIVYFVAGRPLRVTPAPRGSGTSGSGYPEATRPRRVLAPDDDPEFLRTINSPTKKEDEELLRRWEDDLRQREADLRKQDDPRKQEDTPPTDG